MRINGADYLAGAMHAYKQVHAEIGRKIAELDKKLGGGKKKAGVMKPALSNGRRLTAKGRKKISDTQKRRWAAVRAISAGKKKPKVMAAGR